MLCAPVQLWAVCAGTEEATTAPHVVAGTPTNFESPHAKVN